MASAVRQSPGGCQCGDECKGTLCVTVEDSCLFAWVEGAVVTAKIDGVTKWTGLTDSSGQVCIDLPAGDYDVAAAKDGYTTATWTAITVSCDGYSSISGWMSSGGLIRIDFTVYGCWGAGLSDASISLSGPASATLTPDVDGNVSFYPTVAGVYSVEITHPAFVTYSTSVTVRPACDGDSSTVYKTMVVKSNYQCCEIGKMRDPVSPWPLLKTVTVTDPGGSLSYDADSSCSGEAYGTRTMSHVSSCGGEGCAGVSCVEAGVLGTYPPNDISSGTTAIAYGVTLSSTTISVAQYTPCMNTAIIYRDGWAGDGKCLPANAKALWRYAAASIADIGSPRTDLSTAFAIVSWFPFVASVDFDPGSLWQGGLTDDVRGEPYTTSVVVSA